MRVSAACLLLSIFLISHHGAEAARTGRKLAQEAAAPAPGMGFFWSKADTLEVPTSDICKRYPYIRYFKTASLEGLEKLLEQAQPGDMIELLPSDAPYYVASIGEDNFQAPKVALNPIPGAKRRLLDTTSDAPAPAPAKSEEGSKTSNPTAKVAVEESPSPPPPSPPPPKPSPSPSPSGIEKNSATVSVVAAAAEEDPSPSPSPKPEPSPSPSPKPEPSPSPSPKPTIAVNSAVAAVEEESPSPAPKPSPSPSPSPKPEPSPSPSPKPQPSPEPVADPEPVTTTTTTTTKPAPSPSPANPSKTSTANSAIEEEKPPVINDSPDEPVPVKPIKPPTEPDADTATTTKSPPPPKKPVVIPPELGQNVEDKPTVDSKTNTTHSNADEKDQFRDDEAPPSPDQPILGTGRGAVIQNVHGAPGMKITVCGSPNSTIIDGSISVGEYKGYAIQVISSSYVRVAGFTVQNARKGLDVQNTTWSEFKHITTRMTQQEGIRLRYNSTFNVVAHNNVSYTGTMWAGYGEGVYVGTSKRNSVLAGFAPDFTHYNTIHSNRFGPGVLAENVDIKEFTNGGFVYNNTFAGNYIQGINGAESWVSIKGNNWTVANNTGVGLNIKDGAGFRILLQWENQGTLNNVTNNNCYDLSAGSYCVYVSPATENNRIGCDNEVFVSTAGARNASLIAESRSPDACNCDLDSCAARNATVLI